MKYVVIVTLIDQAIGFATLDGNWTTKHPDAALFDSRDDASAKAEALNEARPTADIYGNQRSEQWAGTDEVLGRRGP